MEPEARDCYVDWYRTEDGRIAKGEMPIEDQRFAGYCDRRATHIRKLAMIMAAGQRNDLVITHRDVERAISTLQNVERNMYKAFSGLGQATHSEATEQVLNYVRSRRKVRRSDVMSRFYRDVDAQTLKNIEEVMGYMKIVRIVHDIDNQEVYYEYIGA